MDYKSKLWKNLYYLFRSAFDVKVSMRCPLYWHSIPENDQIDNRLHLPTQFLPVGQAFMAWVFSRQKVMSRNFSTFLVDLTIWNASMTWNKSPSNKIQHLVYKEKSAKGEIFEYFLLSSLQPHCRVQISIWEHFMNRRDLYFFNSFFGPDRLWLSALLSAVAVVKCGMPPVVVSKGRNLRNTCQRLNYFSILCGSKLFLSVIKSIRL